MLLLATAAPDLANIFGGWEIVLILCVIAILLGAKSVPRLGDGLKRGMEEFLRATREISDEINRATEDHPLEEDDAAEAGPRAPRRSRRDALVLWLAQGFDLGRIPVAPGTFGSLAGLLWFAVLMVPESFTIYLLGVGAGLGLSVWCCGQAERILGQTDPGSVVLDEIVAMPICFLPWVVAAWARLHSMPPVETFFSGNAWLSTLGLFVLFRVFDVIKPWPVRQSQRLPGGWGVTVDDLLAALYVALVSLPFVR